MKSLTLWAPLEQTPSAKGLREGREGRDRITSSNPFLQAVASAEETLEDRDTKIWVHCSGMEDVWRFSQHSRLLAPSPPTHSPTLIELFVSPPVIVGGAPNTLLYDASPAKLCLHSHQPAHRYVTKCSRMTAERLRKGGKGVLAEP